MCKVLGVGMRMLLKADFEKSAHKSVWIAFKTHDAYLHLFSICHDVLELSKHLMSTIIHCLAIRNVQGAVFQDMLECGNVSCNVRGIMGKYVDGSQIVAAIKNIFSDDGHTVRKGDR